MELIAEGDPAMAVAYGAYRNGGRLRCGLLLVHKDAPATVRLVQPAGGESYRVRLPEACQKQAGFKKFVREELEIV